MQGAGSSTAERHVVIRKFAGCRLAVRRIGRAFVEGRLDDGEQAFEGGQVVVVDSGCQGGLVFNPATPLDYLDYVLDKVDVVLLMSVNPGFGGQKFIPGTLAKAKQARAKLDAYERASGRRIRLEIDGGVNTANIAEIARAGVDAFVAGSAVYGAGKDSDPHRYDSIIGALRSELAKV